MNSFFFLSLQKCAPGWSGASALPGGRRRKKRNAQGEIIERCTPTRYQSTFLIGQTFKAANSAHNSHTHTGPL